MHTPLPTDIIQCLIRVGQGAMMFLKVVLNQNYPNRTYYTVNFWVQRMSNPKKHEKKQAEGVFERF